MTDPAGWIVLGLALAWTLVCIVLACALEPETRAARDTLAGSTDE